MNLRRVVHILGLVLWILAGAQAIPLIWSASLGDEAALRGFLAGVATCAAVGTGFRLVGTASGDLFRREGVLIVVGAWVIASFAGAIPYVMSGVLPNVFDALFESTSGFTTTGATTLTHIEAAGRPMLFWRSFTQWLGGIGIVVLFVALLSELGPGARFLFKLEVPGPKAEVLHARVRDTAIALAQIYLVLTVAEVVALLIAGLGLYDALTHTFSTIATGGFSPHSASMGRFSDGIQGIILVFMILGGINFSLYLTFVRAREFGVFNDAELRCYALLLGVGTLIIGIDLMAHGHESHALLDAAFQVVSITTTTGFSTVDFSEWPSVSRALLMVLMVFGACAGSTSGGAKIVRAIVAWRAAIREVRLTFSPNSVIAVTVGRSAVPEESVRSVVALLILWAIAFCIGTLALSIGTPHLVTAASASLATVSNIGPGLAAVGPLADYSLFADWQKVLMVVLMWLGRLEFFALLALFQISFWRR
ncbi:MAG: TrkH family potassium uptake protein [Myxococcota bacterium]|nr:TrkH family potassium uptake protein [Myxococcota bacterium]